MPDPPSVVAPGCASCSLDVLCSAMRRATADRRPPDTPMVARRRLGRRACLLRQGDPFAEVYVIRNGSMMSAAHLPGGGEQVTGFHFPGDVLGLDGLGLREYASDLVALESTELCVISHHTIEVLGRCFPQVQGHLYALMSRELVRARAVWILLGAPGADARVAAFLVGLASRGRPGAEIALSMTRAEIGSYLGLKVETVSRVLSRLHAEGILEVRRHAVRIVAPERLEERARRQV